MALRRGDVGRAAEELRALAHALRRRGDEIGALEAEIELGCALVRQGELAAAAEALAASRGVVERAGLRGLRGRAILAEAAIDAAELRHEAACAALEALLADASNGSETRAERAAAGPGARGRGGPGGGSRRRWSRP